MGAPYPATDGEGNRILGHGDDRTETFESSGNAPSPGLRSARLPSPRWGQDVFAVFGQPCRKAEAIGGTADDLLSPAGRG